MMTNERKTSNTNLHTYTSTDAHSWFSSCPSLLGFSFNENQQANDVSGLRG